MPFSSACVTSPSAIFAFRSGQHESPSSCKSMTLTR